MVDNFTPLVKQVLVIVISLYLMYFNSVNSIRHMAVQQVRIVYVYMWWGRGEGKEAAWVCVRVCVSVHCPCGVMEVLLLVVVVWLYL